MSQGLYQLFSVMSHVLNTKQVLSIDSVNGWARDSWQQDGFITVTRQRDGEAWLVNATVHSDDYCLVRAETWRCKELAEDLAEFFQSLPVVSRRLNKSE